RLIRLAPSIPFRFYTTATSQIYTLSLHDALPIWMVLLLQLTTRALFLIHFRMLLTQESRLYASTQVCRMLRKDQLSLRSLQTTRDRKSTRLNSSHVSISYAVFCLKKKN